ncbi:probable carotene biosynthesis-related protein CBR, chloroplastic at C-terminar half [Coccomyxa sp. Obi]|nr:probable carotene biosynthesis-related protein CBR, chloroplastic at C-terminar half [Coccomyxa sp. Obi]
MEFGRALTANRAVFPAAALRPSRPLSKPARVLVPLRAQATEEAQATISEQDKVQELLAQRQRENTQRIEQQDTASQADLVAENLQASSAAVKFEVFGQTQEAINGRAAMLGFVAAVVAELQTGQSVWSQLAGKYVNGDLKEHAQGLSSLGFGAIVALLTYASIAPQFQAGEKPDSRSFGPFTPFLEAWTGRIAMLGFSGLLLVELIKGNNPVF